MDPDVFDNLLVKLSDMEKQLAAMETARRDSELKPARQSAATKYGIPAELVGRIQGATPAEIEADAKALASALPQGSVQPSLTAEDLLSRMRGPRPGSNGSKGFYDVDLHARKGGGVMSNA